MSIKAVAVVIPARDEEASIGACLASVIAAADAVPALRILIVVVDDASTDRTSQVAATALGSRPHLLIRQDKANVGRARSRGVVCALEQLRPLPSAAIWLAFTDADSIVPADWLRRQLTWARTGASAVAGIVRLPPAARDANATYEAIYAAGIWPGGHRHVHGANMGMAASTYLAAGGFRRLSVGEDTELWRRIVARDATVVSDPALVVETSPRRVSRVVGGHATYLDQLASAG